MLNVLARARLSVVLDPIGRFLARAGVSPDAITVLGTVGVVAAALWFVPRGQLLTGMIVVTVLVLTDMLDGAVARARGGGSKWGALLDSSMDRIADGAIFGSVAYWLAVSGRDASAVAAMLCLVGAFTVSYVKARAEGLGFTCNVGIAERTERLLVIGGGALLSVLGVPYALDVALWVLATLCAVTVGQRLYAVRRQVAG
ncbi:MAG TPA: CDP-alcohol phosphatidyltransferase family protein [Mycobacteriales bacterium]|jgi:CDP-diacylglycerol--glycerol-3-phosphate 3-phosphatidyltransferase|nr:CDP-alcohol phosphatidyltransferase family protein [Mycobacteriales bacterium]